MWIFAQVHANSDYASPDNLSRKQRSTSVVRDRLNARTDACQHHNHSWRNDTQDTYRRIVGKGTFTLEHSVSCSWHSDGGHVRDQEFSQICSHLRIPVCRSTVLRELAAQTVSTERSRCYF